MTQSIILIVAIFASLLVGWYVTYTWHLERVTELEDEIVQQRRRILNLTRDEHHA
jgi:hypothetical protein